MDRIFQNGLFSGDELTYEDCQFELSLYRQKAYCDPYFISGWEVGGKVLLPALLVERTFPCIVQNLNKYYLIEEDICQSQISQYLKRLNIRIPPDQIFIGSSATSLLCFALLVLLIDRAGQPLILEPAYFSVHDTLDLIHQNFQAVCVSVPEFTFDFEKIETILQTEKITALVVTDPVFGAGIPVGAEVYRRLTALVNRHHCVLVADLARTGMDWNVHDEPVLGEQLCWIQEAEQYIAVYSPCKKVFANGVKTGVLFAAEPLIRRMSTYCDSVLGAVSASQAAFLNTLLSEGSRKYIGRQMAENISIAKKNYDMLNTLLYRTECLLFKPQMGHYALAGYPARSKSEREIFKKLLYEANVFTLPMGLYGLQRGEYYYFRVNLLEESEILFDSMENISSI